MTDTPQQDLEQRVAELERKVARQGEALRTLGEAIKEIAKQLPGGGPAGARY
jgi:uncharacterized coiled-coil protein SlyX